MISSVAPDDPPPRHALHPALFLVLFVPFGIVPGFLTVALAFQLSKAGVSTSDIAWVVALSYVAQFGKVLWAPLVDTFSTRKVWYVCSAVVCGAGMTLAGIEAMRPHPSLNLLSAWLMIANFATTTLAMSIESLMATGVPDDQRGRAGGWSQAGNLGGQGIGGGLGLWLIQGAGMTTSESGAALGLLCLLCCLALIGTGGSRPLVKAGDHVEAPDHLGLAANARAIGADLWSLLRSRVGILALLVCFLPIGSGAAQNLWSPIAGEWHASANVVALVNGAMGGVISALGCLVGGWICDRIDRKAAYCLFGFGLSAVAVGMAFGPRTSNEFILWTSVYAFVIGLCYAGYYAVVLEAVGRTAAATKFSLLSGLANVPLSWMTLVDGAANDRFGTRGMLLVEALCGVLGIAVFAALAGVTRRRVV